jgi:hypothetical protein
MHMVFFWILVLGCTVSAWLVGYGMGYLRGARDGIRAYVPNRDFGFSSDGSGEE